MRVRPANKADSAALSALYRGSVEGLGARDYRPEQVAAWAGLAPSAERLNALLDDGRTRLVAEAEGAVVGFIDLEADGHIHFLYRAPHAPAGTAEALYRAAEARADGLLYVEASEAARRFFLKQGFTEVERRDFEVAGVPIHNYAMEKKL